MKKRIEGSQVIFTFEDGLEPVTFDSNKASDANREYAVPFAFASRLGDNAAIARKDVPDGKVTEAMRRDAVLELANHYESGSIEWNMGRSSVVRQNATILAIATKRGCTYAEAEAWIAEKMLAELSE